MMKTILFILGIFMLFFVDNVFSYSPGHCRDVYGAGAIEVGNSCGCANGYIKTGITGIDSKLCSLDNKKCQNSYGKNAEMGIGGICGCKVGYDLIKKNNSSLECLNATNECKKIFGDNSYYSFGKCQCNFGYEFSKPSYQTSLDSSIAIGNICTKSIAPTNINQNNYTSDISNNGINHINEDYINSAKELATKGIINYQENINNYNLNKTISRKEMLKVMMNLSGKNVGGDCEGKFKDMGKNDWGCKYAESALSFGFISPNQFFYPNNDISKIESIKMILQSKNIEVDKTIDWREGYVTKGVELGLFNNFTDYDSKAVRGWIFQISNSMIEDLELNDVLSNLFDNNISNICGKNTIENNNGTCSCMEGYKWEDDNDESNLNCIVNLDTDDEDLDLSDVFKDLFGE